MTKIDIISGFLGAGKTTLIKKLLKEALMDTKVVLIENEFGEIGVDGGFLQEAGIEIKEMNSGCICCSLAGDFTASLKEVLQTYNPDRILIEPSGVGKLSDVIKAVQDVVPETDVALNSAVCVADASKCRMFIKNFGEFFINQIENAGAIVLSRTEKLSEEKLATCISMIREHNNKATIITTPWEKLAGTDILETMEGTKDLEAQLMKELSETHHHHGHDGCHEHGHDGCHKNEHHHDSDCTCGCHGHGHGHEHEHHHAEEVFVSWGMETPEIFAADGIEKLMGELEQEKVYGSVLRAKGMVPASDGTWVYFDYVPGEYDVREGKPFVTGKICVIGSNLKEEKLEELFSDRRYH